MEDQFPIVPVQILEGMTIHPVMFLWSTRCRATGGNGFSH